MGERAQTARLPTPPGVAAEPGTGLARALRGAASQAAELAGGGVALVFSLREGAAPVLRAAAGLPSPDAARALGARLGPEVERCVRSGGARRLAAPRGVEGRAAAGLWILPLAVEDQVQGVLCVGAPLPLGDAGPALGLLAEGIALRLDHDRLRRQLERERVRSVREERTVAEKSDEILELSEALFSQDLELRRSREKLEALEALKSAFVAKVSVALQAPVEFAVQSTVWALADEEAALPAGVRRRLHDAVRAGCSHIQELRNLLELWKLQRGEVEADLCAVDVRLLLEETAFDAREAVQGRPVRVDVHVEESLPPLRTDLGKLRRLLQVLVDNAARYTPAGAIELEARLEPGQLRCEVRDSGIGICPDDQALVFEEFFQVDDAESAARGGLGVGLTLARELVRWLGGEIRLRSDVGRGTRVGFRIPAPPADATPVPGV